MNGVIYARYSSSGQREESIEGQMRVCQEYAEKHGITIIGTYIDRAYTGKNDDRPEFQRMLRDSAKGQFETLLLYKLDRFARNRTDSAVNKTILKKNGVRVLSATEYILDRPEGIILEAVLEGVAEYYSAELAEKVIRGMTENALKCKYNGGTMPLGYTVDSNKYYIINPLTAPIVQEIFARYSDGETVTEITNSLNERGLKTTTGADFNKSSLHSMLKNRRYIGEYKYMDIVHKDSIPPIIDKELFDKVQEITEKNKRAPSRTKAKAEYLLTTKLYCGMCGAFMVGESGRGSTGNVHYYYKCANAKKHRSCKKKTVKKDWIERLVVVETKRIVFQDDMIEYLADLIVDIHNQESSVLPVLQDKLKIVQKGIDNLLDAIQQGLFNVSAKQRLDDLEAEKENLNISIAKEQMEKPILERGHVICWISQFTDGDIDDIEYCRAIIDIFVNSIYLYDDKMVIMFNYKDGTKTVTFEEINRSDLVGVGSPYFSKEWTSP